MNVSFITDEFEKVGGEQGPVKELLFSLEVESVFPPFTLFCPSFYLKKIK